MSAHIGNLKDENGDTFYPITKTNAVLDENNVDVETSISNKVTKTGDLSKIYGTDSSGNQTTLEYQSSQTDSANKIVQRDANRDVLVPTTPTSNNGATSKSYADGLINSAFRTWRMLSNFNDIMPAGSYGYQPSTTGNPTGGWGVVTYFRVDGNLWIVQLCFSHNNQSQIKLRHYINDHWTQWYTIS